MGLTKEIYSYQAVVEDNAIGFCDVANSNTVKQIFDIQNKSRNARIAAGAEDKGYLDGISPYIGYIFTGSIPKPLHTYDSNQQLAAEALESFDKSTDMLFFLKYNQAM